jgi:MFS family permease
MVIMRLLTGTFLRNLSAKKILFASFCFLFLGLICIKLEVTYYLALAGLMLIGAGLAGGFPVMLGFVGERYAKLSGTAFSFVLVVALFGNILVNFGMGVISQMFGIGYLMVVAFTETLVMAILAFIIVRKLGTTKKL